MTWLSRGSKRPAARRPLPTLPRLQVEDLEGRLVPSTMVDLTTDGAEGVLNEALFRQCDAQPTGTGVILVSLLLGTGLAGPVVLATDALVSIVLDIVKAALFQRFDLLDAEAFFTGLVIGFASIPGSAVAAWLVRRMHAHLHVVVMEALILIGGASMLWHSWR